MTTSVSHINSELQTLRDASSSQYAMTNRAMDLAKESWDKVMEYKAMASDITLQFHNVTTKVDRFIERHSTPPHASDTTSLPGTVADAFQAADTALSEGISAMEQELGSSLNRNITARMESSTPDEAKSDIAMHSGQPGDVRFSTVTYRPSTTEPYDSNAAYAAAHPDQDPARGGTPSPTYAASTTTIRGIRRDGDGDGGSTNAFGDGLSPRYNGPSSPRHRNALMRGCTPEILRWHAGGSIGDPVCGCDFMEAENVEALDISPTLAVGIAEDHLGIVENWDNPRWFQKDVRNFGGSADGYH